MAAEDLSEFIDVDALAQLLATPTSEAAARKSSAKKLEAKRAATPPSRTR